MSAATGQNFVAAQDFNITATGQNPVAVTGFSL